MKIKFYFFLFVAVILSSCSKDPIMETAEGLEVKIVVASGGCGQVKTVVINQSQTSRDFSGNTCRRTGLNSIRTTDEQTFQTLTNYLTTLNLFEREIQECARCLDGIDYLLEINDGTQIIEQSISFQNEEQGMSEFITFLEAL